MAEAVGDSWGQLSLWGEITNTCFIKVERFVVSEGLVHGSLAP